MSATANNEQLAYLKNALHGSQQPDADLRKSSEAQLRDARAANPVAFLELLAQIMNEPSQPAGPEAEKQHGMQHLATILFRQTCFEGVIYNDGKGNITVGDLKKSRWFTLPEELRAGIRNKTLETLSQASSTHTENQIRIIAQFVAAIACVEVPVGQWPEFMQMMTKEALQDANVFNKCCCTMVLGYVAEELPPATLPEDDLGLMWDTMLKNCKSDIDAVIKAASKSLTRLAGTSARHFENEAARNQIMEGLFDLVRKHDPEVRKQGLETLLEISRLNYKFMNHYLDALSSMTDTFVVHAKQEQDAQSEGALLAVEIWNVLAEEESRATEYAEARGTEFVGILKTYKWQRLVAMFLDGIAQHGYGDDDQFEDDLDNTISVRCMIALSHFTQVADGDAILGQTLGYIDEKGLHNSQTWQGVFVALSCLACVIEHPSAAEVKRTFSNVIGWIYGLTQSHVKRIRAAAAHVLGQLARFCPELIMADQVQSQNFIAWFGVATEKDEVRILDLAMRAAASLFEALHKTNGSGQLNTFFPTAIQAGLQRLEASGTSQTRIIESVNEIVQFCDNIGLSQTLVELAVSIIGQCNSKIIALNQCKLIQLDKEQEKQKEAAEFLLNNYAGMLQTILARLEGEVGHVKSQVIELVDAISAIPGARPGTCLILNGFLHSIQPTDVVGSFAEKAVAIFEETVTKEKEFNNGEKRSACGLMQDLASNLQDKFSVHLAKVAPLLFNVLEDGSLGTEVKTFAIMALGDVCLTCEAEFRQYLAKTMELLIAAGNFSLGNHHDHFVIAEMRRALIDAFLSIINGIRSPEESSQQATPMSPEQAFYLNGQVTNIFYYVNQLLQKQDIDRTDVELAANIINLYSDIVTMFFHRDESSIQRIQEIEDSYLTNQALIKNSNAHLAILNNFQHLVNRLKDTDDKGESVERFTNLVNQYIVENPGQQRGAHSVLPGLQNNMMPQY